MKTIRRIFGLFPNIGRRQFFLQLFCCVLAAALLTSCASKGSKRQRLANNAQFGGSGGAVAKNWPQQQRILAGLQQNLHMKAEPLDTGGISAQVLSGISFYQDSITPTTELYNVLDYVVGVLQRSRAVCRIIVLGHTDNNPPKNPQNTNQSISLKRAEVVAHYLVSKGIRKSLISFEGRGADYPLADNSTEEGRSVNRRIELLILPGR